ncbi:hypothetical protein OS493_039124 [Desmophyllum pertusum]|uniref:Uncharacterized protein n=1 Tax=Desmophyllum pertusum TaxID=174260 RepID=A0A9X0CPH0_9CNID|nr:hypothetical protein OS493_039124 [Desmophyllum pertusum]
MADAERKKSGSKSFKKKFKGKGDDIKLKVKPKKFTKDIKGDRSRAATEKKANDADDHKKKTFKAKKWKGQEESQDGRNGHSKRQNENKKSNKVFQKMTRNQGMELRKEI